jgi:hypothetical protein
MAASSERWRLRYSARSQSKFLIVDASPALTSYQVVKHGSEVTLTGYRDRLRWAAWSLTGHTSWPPKLPLNVPSRSSSPPFSPFLEASEVESLQEQEQYKSLREWWFAMKDKNQASLGTVHQLEQKQRKHKLLQDIRQWQYFDCTVEVRFSD